MKTALACGAGLLVSLIVLSIAVIAGTRGEYPVTRLVTGDPSLPSEAVAGIQLHMRIVDGPEGAPTIIVLHGGPGGDFRSPQALNALSDQYRVVFHDQRGAGLSQRASAGLLTLSGHLNELEAVIDLTSPDRAPIRIGHMADVFTDHPDNPYHWGEGYTAPARRFGALSGGTWREARTAMTDQLGSTVAGFQGPDLLIAGECSDGLELLQGLHQVSYASAGLATIPGAGHDVVWDNTAATRAALRSFPNR